MLMDRIALTLAIIGGINWGSVGLFRLTWSPGCSADRPPRSAA